MKLKHESVFDANTKRNTAFKQLVINFIVQG